MAKKMMFKNIEGFLDHQKKIHNLKDNVTTEKDRRQYNDMVYKFMNSDVEGIVDMRDALKKVREKSDITINDNYKGATSQRRYD